MDQINWYSFMRRPRLPSPSVNSLATLQKASILVTGAGGSIGGEVSLRLARLRPRSLVLLDSSEQALFALASALDARGLGGIPKLILGNISDEALLEEVFATHRPEFVFHAAAYKHVALLEEHPLAAILNNTLATQTVVSVAGRYTSRVVLLSTDKAVMPTSILGASKQIAERIVISSGGVVLRLANVLGSHGSVVETFLQKLASGDALSITDSGTARYFLTSEETVDLFLATAVEGYAGSVLIPALNSAQTIVALAEFLISTSSPRRNIPLTFTRLRCGEKLREQLWSAEETPIESPVNGTLRIVHRKGSAETSKVLYESIDSLRIAVVERNLETALALVRQLVPTYTPSKTVKSLIDKSQRGFQHR